MSLKRFFSVLVGFVLATLPIYAFELVNSFTESIEPVRNITRNNSGITVDYRFPGACQFEDDLYPGTFHLAIPGFGFNMNPGEPEWLLRWDTFEIPDGFEPSVQIMFVNTTEFQIKLAPARKDLTNNSNEVYSRINVPPVQSYSGWLPSNSVKQGDVKIYRDRSMSEHIPYLTIWRKRQSE